MKVYNKFVESKKEPSNKNDIWFDGSAAKIYKEGNWTTITLTKEATERLIDYANSLYVYEIVEKLPEVGEENKIYILKTLTEANSIELTEHIWDGEWRNIGNFNSVELDLNDYLKKEDSPFEKGSAENSAVLKGGNNKATNANEVAIGRYNESNNDTQFSIGIGTSETDRKNAFEVKQNGDIYVEGVEGRIQDRLNESCAFNPKDVYPDLTAGDLAGRGESVPASFGFRASGGKSIKDGRAYIKRIKGNSVVWNQKVEKTYIDGDRVFENIDVIPQNHKFALIRSKAFGGCYYFPSVDVYDYTLTDGNYAKIFVQSHVGDAEYSRIYSTGESGYIQLIDLTKMFGQGNEPTTIEEYEARKPIVEDEYAYNEGQVIHCNTKSIKSVGDNAWDEQWENGYIYGEGEVSNDGTSGIISKNFIPVLANEEYYYAYPQGAQFLFIAYYDHSEHYISQDYLYASNTRITPTNAAYIKFFAEGVPTYNHDILIRLNHSGWKQGYQPYWQDILPLPIIRKYFPDGMKLAGAAHDEIRYNKASGKWEYSKEKIKSVDLGDLDWSYFPAADGYPFGFFYANPQGRKYGEKNILCGKYAFGHFANDKSILGNSAGENIYIMDSAYTDAASFKASLQGVMLYYEANDWEWVELDAEDQNFRDYYNVADFGTEMSQSNNVPSAAFSADIIYQFNAVDMIREHELEITELQTMIATMQAQLASLTSNY